MRTLYARRAAQVFRVLARSHATRASSGTSAMGPFGEAQETGTIAQASGRSRAAPPHTLPSAVMIDKPRKQETA
jgi:hypothetical protein